MKTLYKNWFVHNCIAHPLSYFTGFFSVNLSKNIHDSTLPEDNDKGRIQNCNKGLLDYTAILSLLGDFSSDCEYTSSRTSKSINMCLHKIELRSFEKDSLVNFGNNNGIVDDRVAEHVVDILSDKVEPVLEKFYNKYKDYFILFYPSGEYQDTLSQGWYLFFDEDKGTLLLECNYRAFKKEK